MDPRTDSNDVRALPEYLSKCSTKHVNQTCRYYVADKAATEQTFSDGWLRTGDILRVDENQNFWVTDRLKEVFISSSLDVMISLTVV